MQFVFAVVVEITIEAFHCIMVKEEVICIDKMLEACRKYLTVAVCSFLSLQYKKQNKTPIPNKLGQYVNVNLSKNI